MSDREQMETCEKTGIRPERSGGPALHRIDQQRVARMVRDGVHTPGFERLRVMVETIIPRLEQGGPTAGG
jgi:hypothetical protein